MPYTCSKRLFDEAVRAIVDALDAERNIVQAETVIGRHDGLRFILTVEPDDRGWTGIHAAVPAVDAVRRIP